MERKLWSLFISYRFGGYYCGVYPSIRDVKEVVREMSADMEISDDELEIMIAEKDDYWHEFSDGTWIHVQEISEQLVNHIFERWVGNASYHLNVQ